MTFDLGFFGDGEAARRQLETERVSGGSHLSWLNAAVRVLYVNVSVITLLHDPVSAFAHAVNQEPVLQSDESYRWSFEFTEDGKTIAVDLSGRLDGVHMDWELRVTSAEAPRLRRDRRADHAHLRRR
jgi:hypothetical protein